MHTSNLTVPRESSRRFLAIIGVSAAALILTTLLSGCDLLERKKSAASADAAPQRTSLINSEWEIAAQVPTDAVELRNFTVGKDTSLVGTIEVTQGPAIDISISVPSAKPDAPWTEVLKRDNIRRETIDLKLPPGQATMTIGRNVKERTVINARLDLVSQPG